MNIIRKKTVSRKKPLQNRSRERVELILETTEKLISEMPIPDISTSKIAKTAGIPVGSIYQYFNDRDAVLLELGERLIDREDALLEQVFDMISTTLPWKLVVQRVLRAYAESMRQSDTLYRLDMALAHVEEWIQIHRRSEDRMTLFFASYPAFSDNGLSPEKAQTVARMIVITATTIILRVQAERDEESVNTLVEEAEKLIIAYLSLYLKD
ncbi:TetR/AcrR family transcriptional regulator [Sneathiella chinensis]|uniref:TetR family transcriptional regulator n=1 Tax=Sneathiella chinensis TaxID=349750 RepID=A0ABQ5U074_9PROT|nr:TetR/AcrR family transcriptional regulator [Sneathiella chinensis]GLQ05535.1 TetR family transcriptional regulator [Sneathiella chinensis]